MHKLVKSIKLNKKKNTIYKVLKVQISYKLIQELAKIYILYIKTILNIKLQKNINTKKFNNILKKFLLKYY